MRAKSTLGAVLLIALALPVAVLARTAQWVAGNSGDIWENGPAEFCPLSQILQARRLFEGEAELLASKAAVAQLEELSVRPASRSIISEAVLQMEARKREAGSWTSVEEARLDRTRRLARDGSIPGEKAYLVRAFRWPDRPTQIVVDVCGERVRTVALLNELGPHPKPARAAALIVLPAAPAESFATWVERTIPVPDDWDTPPR